MLHDCNTEHPASEYTLHALLEMYHEVLLSQSSAVDDSCKQYLSVQACADSSQ
jgi:hypothetical protein